MSVAKPESLYLVGEALSLTLDDARGFLESFAEGDGGAEALEQTASLLHMAKGALHLTETYGASLLAEEMEETCRFMAKHRHKEGESEEGIEALSRAMVQLPVYVDRILAGGRDIPLVLLPLLNDLRAARGQRLLSEGTLLLLNLGKKPTEVDSVAHRKPSGEDIAALSKGLRPQFQLGLLGLVKGGQVKREVRKMSAVAERLEQAAESDEVYQLWWVVGGVLEALSNGGLEVSVAIKRLLGQADREIKRLQSSGEAEYANQPPTELINNLLYYIARSSSGGGRVREIRAAFNLSDMSPGDEQVEIIREALAGPSAELMKTVANAIREDLAKVKDVLDIYVRTGMDNVEELGPQAELLKKISDTLGVLGLGALRQIVQDRSNELLAIVQQKNPLDEGTMEKIAADLLSVEDRLDAELIGQIAPQENEVETDAEFQQVTKAVMRECIVNLARIKETIGRLHEKPDDSLELDNLPTLILGIIAGLTMLEQERGVQVVNGINDAITRIVRNSDRWQHSENVNRLADAVVSLEYYMETIQAGRKEPAYMLDDAQRSLSAITEAEPPVAEHDGAGHEATVKMPKLDVEALAELANPTPAVEGPAKHEPPVISREKQKFDPSLLEIFIEEAREEIASIAANFPAWRDEANLTALATVCRSFHTLKGSGRMVGAESIGEFCWSVESLLNRLIDNTLIPVPELVQSLTDAVAVLPELLEQLEIGTPPAHDITQIIATMEAYAAGEIAEEPVQEMIPAEAMEDSRVIEQIELQAEPEPERSSSIDPVLLDILSKEATTHIGVMNSFIEDCKNSAAPYAVPEPVFRSCHTLLGSVTMAKVQEAAVVLRPLNMLIEVAYEQGTGISEEILAICVEAVIALEAVFYHLGDISIEVPETADLAERMRPLIEQLDRDARPAKESLEATDVVDEQVISLPPAEEIIKEPLPLQEFDAEIAAIFSDEATEILEAADSALAQLAAGGDRATAMAELQRHLHTLKGGARMAGVSRIGDFSHELETLLNQLDDGGVSLQAGIRDLLQTCIDELHRMCEQVLTGSVGPPPPDLLERLRSAHPAKPDAAGPFEKPTIEPKRPESEIDTFVAESMPPAEDLPAAPVGDEIADSAMRYQGLERLGELARELTSDELPDEAESIKAKPEPTAPPQISEPEGVSRVEMARVDSQLLEDVLNSAGEISIYHSRINQQVGSIQFNLEELDQTVVRLREQLRKLEIETEAQILYRHQGEPTKDDAFDPLELDRYSTIQQLSRALAETASDVSSLKDLLQNITSETETLLTQQGRTTVELQDNLMRTRMVPFHQHVSRLSRLVRQIATESRKKVELIAEGSSGELDRQVMEKMLPPFEHMLRNAVIHGIESAEERNSLGKPRTGRISIVFRREGSEVVIDIFDDGRGLDIPAIKAKAELLGFLRPGQTVTDEEAIQLILRSGFSTADRLTQTAGRGIGMDVVANEVAKLGGSLDIKSAPGRGSVFTVRLPYTLAVTQAFVVRVGAEVYALPLPSVEGIVRIPRREFDERITGDDPAIEYGSQKFRFRHLGQYLGLGPSRLDSDEDQVSIILVRAGENSAALIADEMLDNREIVVKPIGPQLATVKGVSGATILGDGRIAVILDVAALVRSTDQLEPLVQPLPSEEPEDQPPLALVVDDSITMRRITQRLLERSGMRVMTATDGVEAVKVLQDHVPDIILLDVEMPRMDGYELAKYVRNSPEIAETPIIMVTSRVSEKHRARAIELGVNDYVGKPYQEKELLTAIHGLLPSVAE
ncbi:MAG: Hpt domain-containing protein [Gammaproteobacteria bacterium]